MVRRIHLLALVGLVALIVSFAEPGAAWAQTHECTPCRTVGVAILTVEDGILTAGVGAELIPGVGDRAGSTDAHSAWGTSALILVVHAFWLGEEHEQAIEPWKSDFGLRVVHGDHETVTAPATKSVTEAVQRLGPERIASMIIRMYGRAGQNIAKGHTFHLDDPRNDDIILQTFVEHEAGPLCNLPETHIAWAEVGTATAEGVLFEKGARTDIILATTTPLQ